MELLQLLLNGEIREIVDRYKIKPKDPLLLDYQKRMEEIPGIFKRPIQKKNRKKWKRKKKAIRTKLKETC